MHRPLDRARRADPEWYCGMRQKGVARVLVLGTLALQIYTSHAAKILVLTAPLGLSHNVNLRGIAEELSQQRGHHITVQYTSLDQ